MKPLPLALALLALATSAYAQAGIAVSPNRVIFNPKQRTAEAAITNNSTRPVRYRIDLVDQVMTISGTTTQKAEAPYSAITMLRYMPKMVTLEPGKRQTIRIMANRPEGLADGDYHAHMLFNEVPTKADPSATTTRENTVSFDIAMSYSVGIPVIVQQGEISSTVTLISATLIKAEDGSPKSINATLHRNGNAEGVTQLAARMGAQDVAPAKTVRLYREVDVVEVNMQLNPNLPQKPITLVQLPFNKVTSATLPLKEIQLP